MLPHPISMAMVWDPIHLITSQVCVPELLITCLHYIKIQFFIYHSDFFVFGHVKTSLHYIHGTSRQILTNNYKFFHKKRKKRYCIDFLLHTISFFYIYTFIVFAREVSKAAISGLPSTFISSSGFTPSGMVILFSSPFSLHSSAGPHQ